ncbi:MAG TPA: hypothetical protein VM686_11750 [Polyangiaceae bacterium]|nr:hypothetical protein [Polyangiaceae bacterium]
MKTPVDERLRVEARRFELRFTCEHCAHFDVGREACANGYPTEAHQRVDLAARAELLFCKEFELA